MSLLAALRAKKQNHEDATLTVATGATHQSQEMPTVARVATVNVARLGVAKAAAATDLDRWCWPQSAAMNTGELDAFTARQARFTDMGVCYADAEQLADRLKRRDRGGDDRRVCVECSSLCWSGSWHCGNSKKAGLRVRHLPKDFVLLLQRCDGFGVAGFENFQMISGKRKF